MTPPANHDANTTREKSPETPKNPLNPETQAHKIKSYKKKSATQIKNLSLLLSISLMSYCVFLHTEVFRVIYGCVRVCACRNEGEGARGDANAAEGNLIFGQESTEARYNL